MYTLFRTLCILSMYVIYFHVQVFSPDPFKPSVSTSGGGGTNDLFGAGGGGEDMFGDFTAAPTAMGVGGGAAQAKPSGDPFGGFGDDLFGAPSAAAAAPAGSGGGHGMGMFGVASSGSTGMGGSTMSAPAKVSAADIMSLYNQPSAQVGFMGGMPSGGMQGMGGGMQGMGGGMQGMGGGMQGMHNMGQMGMMGNNMGTMMTGGGMGGLTGGALPSPSPTAAAKGSQVCKDCF